MSTETETTAATPVKRPTPKKAPAKKASTQVSTKKAATKKAPKKAAKKTTTSDAPAEYGQDRSHDLPWHDKKVAVFKALKSLKAVGATNPKSAATIAEKAGLTARDVRHYCYHAKAAGLTGVATSEEIRGLGFYLTTKGAALDPTKEQKAEQASKAAE